MQINQFQDPNVYAQQYASQNGISIDEAKSQLKAKYGDPSEQGPASLNTLTCDTFTSSSQNVEDIFANITNDESVLVEFFKGLIEKLKGTNTSNNTESKSNKTSNEISNQTSNKLTTKTTNNPSDKTKEADDEVVNYANHHNCSYSEAREALKNKFGSPKDYDNSNTKSSSYTVAADDEVVNYANHHNCSYAEAREALKKIWGDPK